MSAGDWVEMEGVVEKALGGGQYSVQLDGEHGLLIRASLAGKMGKNHIRVLPGDRVRVGVSPYDTSHGKITYRHK